MATSSRTKANAPSQHRSIPATYSSSSAAASAFASSASSTFSSRAAMFSRASSPTSVSMYGNSSTSPSPSVRFAMDHRSISPGRSFSVSKQSSSGVPSRRKKTCTCSPTNHPGSFRCALHRGVANGGEGHSHAVSYQSRSLNFRRSAMNNSLVRIGGVEGDLVKRALAALIRPSSHQQRRRAAFHPRPSRLSVMCRADDL